MTREQAEAVRAKRLEGCTYRRIAEDCHREWGGDWKPPSNQLVGEELVREAAELLGEDHHAWDDQAFGPL